VFLRKLQAATIEYPTASYSVARCIPEFARDVRESLTLKCLLLFIGEVRYLAINFCVALSFEIMKSNTQRRYTLLSTIFFFFILKQN